MNFWTFLDRNAGAFVAGVAIIALLAVIRGPDILREYRRQTPCKCVEGK